MLLTAILAKILPVTFLENGILMYGTAMPQRLKYLKSMWQMKLKRGEFRFRRDRNALMVRLQDKNEIFFVSTRYSAKTCNGDEGSERKLVLNKDYNKYVGGLDKNDALIGNYSSCWKNWIGQPRLQSI